MLRIKKRKGSKMAIDRRKKDTNWALKIDGNGYTTTPDAQLAVLMDIRDELKQLNRLLHCPNFTRMPYALDRIRLNTKKRKRRIPKTT